MSAISTAIITLLTALLTASAALIGVYLTNKANVEHIKIRLGRESKEKHRILIRERAEELYELADDWIKGMFTNYLHLTSVMQDKLDYNQYLDLVIENGEKK